MVMIRILKSCFDSVINRSSYHGNNSFRRGRHSGIMTYFKLSDSPKHAKLRSLIDSAPKAQLHLHLDGSLSFKFIMASLKRLKERKKGFVAFDKNWEPSTEDELVLWMMRVAKGQQEGGMVVKKAENWRVFTVCNYFLQTKIDLIEATHDLVTRLALQHNVNYLEIRFAPCLHTEEGLTELEVVHAVLEGFEKAKIELAEKKFSMDGGFILCALRSFAESEAIKTVNLIKSLNHENILGFDIAGDEGTYPLKRFEGAIKLALDSKLNVTVHAGEWNEVKHSHVVEGLRLAVDLGVKRIGHGVALRSLDASDEIFTKMEAKNTSVEICVTSNCDDPTKVESYSKHPLTKFVGNGVKIAGLNCDNLLLAGNQKTGLPDPSGEFTRAILDCGLSHDHVLTIVESTYRAAFKPLSNKFIEDALKIWKEKVLPHLSD